LRHPVLSRSLLISRHVKLICILHFIKYFRLHRSWSSFYLFKWLWIWLLLRSIPCIRVWHWKITFSHGLQNQIKVILPFTIYQIIDKKCIGQPLRVFIGRCDYLLIFRCVTPWRDFFYFKYNVSSIVNESLIVKWMMAEWLFSRILALEAKKGHIASSHPDVTP
jgi:hypothetical protein